MRKITIVLLSLFLFSFFSIKNGNITIFLAGDSTCAIKETKAYPETGWGMPFVYFWDSTVTVVNKAKNGRSTSSFRNEGLWKQIMDEGNEGDYVFVQFGHNDEVSTKKTYTTETEFCTNLVNYVKDTRTKKMTPVLLTPVARRKFDSTGHIENTHAVYSQIVREVAAKEKVLFIDADKLSQALLQNFGEEKSKLLFLQLEPGEHPNYPEGKIDNTHFNELGARLVAQLVLKEIKTICPELAERIIKPVKK